MKILYYSPHPHLFLKSASGFGVHMREMIHAFKKDGHHVELLIMGGIEGRDVPNISNSGKSSFKDLVKKGFGKTFWRFMKDINLLRFDRFAEKELVKCVQKFKPDMIYERSNYLQLSGVNVANRFGIKHVLEVNTPYIEQVNKLSGTRSPIEKLAYKIEKSQLSKTDIVITLESSLKKHFVNLHGIPEKKCLITPDAFNEENILLNTQNQRKIKESYHLEGKKVIGYLGSIFEWHGIDMLIQAFNKLNDEDLLLMIVGDGEYASKLKELASNSARVNDIIFTGKVGKEEVFDYINVMDICVAPNAEWYQSPIKIFEYGAMGKPVLAPDISSVREIMNHQEDGYLSRPDTECIYTALNEMLSNHDQYVQMGLNFREKVFNEFTWDKNAKRVIEKINSL